MEPANDPTTLHVRRACDGGQESLTWLIAHFTPLLQAQASYRLRGRLREVYDPEDLVADVWVTALPRLGDLQARANRLTPVLLKFLSSTLLHKANRLIEKHLSRPRHIRSSEGASATDSDLLERLPADITHATTAAERDEASCALRVALAELDARDHEVIILRGVEQLPNEEVARLLGVTPGAVTRRYQGALRKLRYRLPGSILDDLPDDPVDAG